MNAAPATTDHAAPPTRQAATMLLLRDTHQAFEIFMMVRHDQIDFASGALVFPGGSVDKNDVQVVTSLPNKFGMSDEQLGLRVAAIRETFEECGILLASNRAGKMVDAATAEAIANDHRIQLCQNKITFGEILSSNELLPAVDNLVRYAHWVTPEGMPKRFDTHFYIALAPAEQAGMHDGHESVDSVWVSPADALKGAETGRFKLLFPTTRNLIKLAKHNRVDEVFVAARESKVVTVTPIMSRSDAGVRLTIPEEAGYDGTVFDVGRGG